LVGQLFDAKTAERFDLINRICKPADLTKEVDALIAVIAAKNPVTLRRSKFVLNKSADLPVPSAMAFEVPIQPFDSKPGRFATNGMEDFAKRETRSARRKVSKTFWQE
jgi:enoyl-CoA hydratase/carnithine racemase